VAAEDGGLEIGLEYRFRADSLKGSVHDYTQYDPSINPLNPMDPANFVPVKGYDVKNDTVMMNRFGINMKANPSKM